MDEMEKLLNEIKNRLFNLKENEREAAVVLREATAKRYECQAILDEIERRIEKNKKKVTPIAVD